MMKKTIKKVLILSLISFFIISVTIDSRKTFGGEKIELSQRLNELKGILNQARYNKEEIEKLLFILEIVTKEDLPIDLLINKVKEGVSKRVKLKLITDVINKKIKNLITSKRLIKDWMKKGMSVEDVNYAIQVLAELFERGIVEGDLVELANVSIASKIIDFKGFSEIYEILIELSLNGIPYSYSKEIIVTAIIKNRKDIDKIAKLIFEAKSISISMSEMRDIIIEGIINNKRISKIRADIIEARKEGIKERISEEQKEKSEF